MKWKALTICFLIMAVFCSGAFAYEDKQAAARGTNVSSDNSNQNQNAMNQGIFYNPTSVAKDNVSVGALPQAYGTGTQLMDYRPGYLNSQAVEAPLVNLIKFGPPVVTREMLEIAKSRVVDKNGKPVYEKEVWKNMVIRDAIYYENFPANFAGGGKIPKTSSVRQLLLRDFPADAVEGVDYLWLGPIIAMSKSKEELVFIHNLRDGVHERAMDRGANAVVFEGQGADRDIKAGSTAANFWSSLAQLFGTSNPWGFNVSPGVAFQGGITSEITKPFVGGIGIYIANQDKFPLPDRVAKLEPEIDQFSQLKKEVDQTEKGLADCKTYCFNNLVLRNRQGKNFLQAAQLNRAAGKQAEAIEALKIADYHFGMAEKNYAAIKNQKDDQARARELFHDSIYWRAGVINSLQGQAVANQYAQRHGLERFPKFN